ncbi:hypothetical protein F441_07551, partial [Phytophthora nicotianae CJ01A1]
YTLAPLWIGYLGVRWIHKCDNFEGTGSALVVNQSTKKLEMPLEMDLEEPTTSQHWWKWLAYALFSKRAHIEALSSILTSEHPKKFFLGAAELNKRGQPSRGAQHLTFETLIKSARIFSDDGSSEWINALVLDYGRCYVQRTGLELQDTTADSASGVMDLKIEFVKDMESILDSLPSFLAAIGYLLKTSTIDISEIEFDVNEIENYRPAFQAGLRAHLDMLLTPSLGAIIQIFAFLTPCVLCEVYLRDPPDVFSLNGVGKRTARLQALVASAYGESKPLANAGARDGEARAFIPASEGEVYATELEWIRGTLHGLQVSVGTRPRLHDH